jgi:hypothetical protein
VVDGTKILDADVQLTRNLAHGFQDVLVGQIQFRHISRARADRSGLDWVMFLHGGTDPVYVWTIFIQAGFDGRQHVAVTGPCGQTPSVVSATRCPRLRRAFYPPDRAPMPPTREGSGSRRQSAHTARRTVPNNQQMP